MTHIDKKIWMKLEELEAVKKWEEQQLKHLYIINNIQYMYTDELILTVHKYE